MDFLNYLMLILYAVGMVAIAIYCHKKKSAGTTKDFLMAGEGLGGWMSAFAFGTTYFSSVIFIGYAGELGWKFGLSVIWIGVGNAVIGALLAWKVLAARTRSITQFYNVRTMPELFEKRYESGNLKLFSSLIIFVFLIPYSASVYKGLAQIFESVFHIPFLWCIITMAVLTALYLFFGGYLATAISDFIQGLIMLAGVAVMVFFIFGKIDFDLSGLTQNGFGIFPTEGGNAFDLIVMILLTSFGVWGLPQSIHKFYAVKSKSAIKKATVISTVFCLIIGVGAYATGAVGRLFFPDGLGGMGYDGIVPAILVRCLPAGLLGLIVVLVLSASMSTLSSLSLSGSSAIAIDLYRGYIKKDASDRSVNLVMKLSCLLFVLISVLLAVFQVEAIVTLMSLSWGTLAGCFIGPYVLGLYSKKINRVGAYASLIAGLGVTLILTVVFGIVDGGTGIMGVLGAGVKHAPLIGVIAMATSVIVTPLFSLFGKAPVSALEWFKDPTRLEMPPRPEEK